MGDPDALLARYRPAPDRAARVVLHPHLTVVPCRAEDFDGLCETFALDVAARVFTAPDVRAAIDAADRAERAAEYDALIDAIASATGQHQSATNAADIAERTLQEARVRLDHVAVQRAHADEAFMAARERLLRLEGLDRAPRTGGDPAAEAEAIRAQIAAVQRSLDDATSTRGAAVSVAEREAEAARRDTSAATRRLQVALERAEPAARLDDARAVLVRLRDRRALLDDDDVASEAFMAFRRLAEAPEPVLVLVEPFGEPPADLFEAAESLVALKRIVLVTDNTQVLRRARELDPELGAVRTPLVTAAIARVAAHGSDWNSR
ncbi:MAG: hypothetical protein ACT4OX_10005 [Actinomycetota bacterium]